MNRVSVIVCTLVFVLLHQVSIAQKATVSANKMNVFYIGIDNPVTIMAEGLKCEEIVAEMNPEEGVIEQDENHGKCAYNVRVKTQGKTTIYVYEKKERKKRSLIDSCVFRIKRFPDLVTTIGGTLKGGVVRRSELSAQSGIILRLEGFDFDYRFNVVSFSLYYCKEGKVSSIKTYGPLFNNDVRKALTDAKYGDVLIFDDIRGVSPDGAVRKMPPVKFIIDGYRDKLCDSGKLSLPFAPLFYGFDSKEYMSNSTSANMNCECNCIDEAIGSYDGNRKKTGWWIYNKIDSGKKATLRKEYFIEDTTTQYFYTKNYISKLRNYTGTMLNGKYAEYHADKVLSIEGQYAIDTIGFDTLIVTDPMYLNEIESPYPIIGEAKAGTWNYYTPAGKLYRREHYQKGKLMKEENF